MTQNFVHDNLTKDLKYDGTGSGNTFPEQRLRNVAPRRALLAS